MRVPALGLFLFLGCTTPQTSDWDRVAAAARALRPPVPAGDAAILDGLEARARDTLTSLKHPLDRDSWTAAVPQLRQELRRSLGLQHFPEPSPRKLRAVGTLSRDGYTIEKLVYETLPGTEVPAHLYLPSSPGGRVPAILFVPGHWYADSKTRPDFQAFAVSMVRRGVAVLTYDPFGQGERGISVRDHRRTELLAAGIAQEAVVAFESLCAFALLRGRPEVDPERIGMTGASGGGFNSWIVPALEPRIAVTVPVVGTSEFLEQSRAVRNADWFAAKEHCHYIPGLFRFANNHELLACVAPRPVMVISAHNDIGFPIPGQRDVVKYGESLYAALGAAGRVGYFEDEREGHGYQKRKREASAGWFLKWLKNEGDGRPAEEPPLKLPAWDDPELRCFPPGENRPAGPGLVALAAATEKDAAGPALLEPQAHSNALIRGLGLPPLSSLPASPDLVLPEPRSAIGAAPDPAQPVIRVSWRTPDGVSVPGVLIRPRGTPRGALVAIGDEGKEALLDHPAVRAARDRGWALLLADVRGTGELTITRPGWVYAISLLLGENVVGRQAVDLVLGIRALRGEPWMRGRPVGVLAIGRFAAHAGLYAATMENGVSWFAGERGFSSFHAFVERPRSAADSFVLAAAGRERDVVLDREIPHALIPFDAAGRMPSIFSLLKNLGSSAVWAAAVDGDFDPAPGPDSCLDFVLATLEKTP